MTKMRVRMDDIEVISADDEWEDVPGPFIGTRQIAVVCGTCGVVSLFKYHTPRSGFSFDCPKCRKRVAMRGIQKRYYQRKRLRDADSLSMARRALLHRINAMIDNNEARMLVYRERASTKGRRPNARAMRIFQRRTKLDVYYKTIRTQMELDIRRGDTKPFMSYFSEDEYAKIFGSEGVVASSSEPATDEPEVV